MNSCFSFEIAIFLNIVAKAEPSERHEARASHEDVLAAAGDNLAGHGCRPPRALLQGFPAWSARTLQMECFEGDVGQSSDALCKCGSTFIERQKKKTILM